MNERIQKHLFAGWVCITTAAAFAVLLVIINLDQVSSYLSAALVIWIYLWLVIVFFYDLHFKETRTLHNARIKHATIVSSMSRFFAICADAVFDRVKHLLIWKQYSQAVRYLLLPGLLFWGTIIVFYIELGHYRIQYIIAGLSVIAITINYFYIKEVFSRNKIKADRDVFIALSVVKIYTAAILFGGTMAIMRRFCLDPQLFSLALFCLTFLLLYQSLFQDGLLSAKAIGGSLILSAFMSVLAWYVYILWSFNFFTAAIFFATCYNLIWGTYHYHLDHSLDKKTFVEIFFVCLLIAGLVLSNTNFKERILDECSWSS